MIFAGALFEQEGVLMSEYNHENRCPECDATGGHHYLGCTYEGTEGNYRYSSGSGNGMSTFGAILCVIGGFVGVALLLMILNIEVDDVPGVVLVILIIVITSVIGGVVSAIKGK